jgi:hypothetical protein
MKNYRFESWLNNVYHTQDEEISCTECFELESSYVELEVTGEDPVAKMPQVKQHIDQCPACRAEYETLRDLQRFEDEGGALSVDALMDLIH